MFLNPFPGAFGLDIGDLSIKMLQLTNTSRRRGHRSYEVAACRSTKLPKGLIIDGIIQEPEKVKKYLVHLLYDARTSKKPIRSQWVVASIPDTQAFIKRIDIQKKLTDVIEEDINDAAHRHIPFGEDDYYIDWQATSGEEQGEKTSILVTAVPKRIADMYTHLLESLGLGVIALEPEAIALTRAMITAQKTYTHEARGILNLGATRSSLTVYDHDQIQFTVSLPFSGEYITDALARECKLPYQEAEKQKITTGLAYTKNQVVCWTSLTRSAEILTKEIQKSMQFYTTHFSDTNPITHITMCGGGAMMKRLDRVLSLKLKTTTRPGNVWKNLSSKKSPPLSPEESLRFAVVIGLAIRASANPFFLRDTI